jgi:L,D-transpeptidase ErfK/SrfK
VRLSAAVRAGLGALAAPALLASCAPAPPGIVAPEAKPVAVAVVGGALVGGESTYVVAAGDSLTGVSARFAVDVAPLARANGLSPRSRLRVGQKLRIESLHVVPVQAGEEPRDGILINVPQRMLFLLRDGAAVAHFPVGLGAPATPTPLGEFTIRAREVDKTWYVPASIQEEMRRKGEPVQTEIPPGPENPLGRHWLGLDAHDCGIHGTIAPASIYRFRTHGCIRLHPDDVAWLYERVTMAEAVRIVYLPVMLAALPDGRIFLEAHRDVYGRADEPPLAAARRLADAAALAGRVDWERAARVVDQAEGIAREVGAAAGGAR